MWGKPQGCRGCSSVTILLIELGFARMRCINAQRSRVVHMLRSTGPQSRPKSVYEPGKPLSIVVRSIKRSDPDPGTLLTHYSLLVTPSVPPRIRYNHLSEKSPGKEGGGNAISSQ